MSDDIIDFIFGGIAKIIGKIVGAIASVLGQFLMFILRGIWHGLGYLWDLFIGLFHNKK